LSAALAGTLATRRDQNGQTGVIMRTLTLLAAYLLLPLFSAAQEPAPEPAPPALAELASAADLIAVVRVLDTDYAYTREFPSGGSAFLEVLVPYKVSRPLEDIIEVYEEGLHAGECYFRNPTVLQEGSRHLVFLRFSEDVEDQYNGLEPGCSLEVLVTTENRYALRFPLNGMDITDELSGLATEMVFQDENALIRDEDITPPVRVSLVEQGYLVPEGERFRLTHGVPLEEVRKLLGPAGLTLDRSLK
jgi:hypothetical protein